VVVDHAPMVRYEAAVVERGYRTDRAWEHHTRPLSAPDGIIAAAYRPPNRVRRPLMTLTEALAVLATPTVYARIHHLFNQATKDADVGVFRATMLAELADSPLIQLALQTLWQHYATVPLDTVVHMPLPDMPDPSCAN
jgi:hypothetical protein